MGSRVPIPSATFSPAGGLADPHGVRGLRQRGEAAPAQGRAPHRRHPRRRPAGRVHQPPGAAAGAARAEVRACHAKPPRARPDGRLRAARVRDEVFFLLLH